MATMHQMAAAAYVRDVWFDGNEEIVEIGATCPNADCGEPLVTSFTRPGITLKMYQCRSCGTRMHVVRPAFSYEVRADAADD